MLNVVPLSTPAAVSAPINDAETGSLKPQVCEVFELLDSNSKGALFTNPTDALRWLAKQAGYQLSWTLHVE